MEILSLTISIIIAIAAIYYLGRSMMSKSEAIQILKEPELIGLFITAAIGIIFSIFASLCALNNNYWQIPYYMSN